MFTVGGIKLKTASVNELKAYPKVIWARFFRTENAEFVFVKDVSNSKEARAAFVLLSEKAVNSDIFIEKNRENA